MNFSVSHMVKIRRNEFALRLKSYTRTDCLLKLKLSLFCLFSFVFVLLTNFVSLFLFLGKSLLLHSIEPLLPLVRNNQYSVSSSKYESICAWSQWSERALLSGADNGPVGHGSWVKWVNKSGWVTWVMGQFTDGLDGSWVIKCD